MGDRTRLSQGGETLQNEGTPDLGGAAVGGSRADRNGSLSVRADPGTCHLDTRRPNRPKSTSWRALDEADLQQLAADRSPLDLALTEAAGRRSLLRTSSTQDLRPAKDDPTPSPASNGNGRPRPEN